MPNKVWDEIIRYQNFNGGTVEGREWIREFISHSIIVVVT